MLAKAALLRYNNYSDKKRVIICVLKGILDVCFFVKSTQKGAVARAKESRAAAQNACKLLKCRKLF